jgi:hypothetical protein
LGELAIDCIVFIECYLVVVPDTDICYSVFSIDIIPTVSLAAYAVEHKTAVIDENALEIEIE